ncbi:MAG TPA: sulfur carrier protein ThiS [Nitrospirota bacterium]|nr:sulfur carrier protein ThiS [Nitrospirota bacterium]
MILTVNGKVEALVPAELSVTALLDELRVKQAMYVSVELNGGFLDRKAFDTTVVRDGDRVEFLYFMGGGGRVEALQHHAY